jgi:hypothetical protein
MKTVTTRKSHDCLTCGKPITKGDKAKVIVERFDRSNGEGTYFETCYYHIACPIRRLGELV